MTPVYADAIVHGMIKRLLAEAAQGRVPLFLICGKLPETEDDGLLLSLLAPTWLIGNQDPIEHLKGCVEILEKAGLKRGD